MRPSRLLAVLALVLVSGTLVFFATTSHEESVPDLYYSLDKTKPWNELAQRLDPRMSDDEYNAMRKRYFYDLVAPQLKDSTDTLGAYAYFLRQTERPWNWSRRPIGLRILRLLFWISTVYLIVFASGWIWKGVLKPAGRITRDEGLAGLANVALHGRKSRPSA